MQEKHAHKVTCLDKGATSRAVSVYGTSWHVPQVTLPASAGLDIGVSPEHDMAWYDPVCKRAEPVRFLESLCSGHCTRMPAGGGPALQEKVLGRQARTMHSCQTAVREVKDLLETVEEEGWQLH